MCQGDSNRNVVNRIAFLKIGLCPVQLPKTFGQKRNNETKVMNETRLVVRNTSFTNVA